jgi:FkbM family methyltransferase
VVIDIGANVGIFSMWVARHAAHANVYAFEPMSENCEAMRGNLHGWSHHVRLCQAAVGRRSGHGQMARRPDRTLDHRLLESSTAATDHEEVEVLTLAQAVDVASAPAIDFLKMDIEGGEVDALEGADRSLLSRIRRVALEFHDNIRPGALSRVKDLLSRTHRIVDVHGDAYGILRAEVL